MITALCLLATVAASGQEEKGRLARDLEYTLETQLSCSSGNTPLWLNANKYGLSSLDETNGYARARVERKLQADSMRRWGIGYGVDVALPLHYTSNVVVQQAYGELRWLKGVLTVGSKQQPMELKNQKLSSGSQTLGINARPVPQVRLALQDYWTVPLTKGWLQFKGHLAYGMLTDENWQHDFTGRQHNYAENVLYHSKAGYLRIGDRNRLYPLSLEMGLEMVTLFGGTAYRPKSDGTVTTIENKHGLKSFWHAFMPGGSDVTDGAVYGNIEGDDLGSWVLRLNYDTEMFAWHFYVDKYFDDHSAMFLLDYDGYGEAENYAVKQDSRFFVYDPKDMMLGMELNLKYGTLLQGIVMEYLYTKYQSGPIYHDHTYTISDHIGGRDNYYNHGIYSSYQHWGQVMGNPLYRSPIYNEDGTIEVRDNRFFALHLGLNGRLAEPLDYRVLATWQEGLGTYTNPYTKYHHNFSLLTEATYTFNGGWQLIGAYGMDVGSILGHNYGGQLTLRKTL